MNAAKMYKRAGKWILGLALGCVFTVNQAATKATTQDSSQELAGPVPATVLKAPIVDVQSPVDHTNLPLGAGRSHETMHRQNLENDSYPSTTPEPVVIPLPSAVYMTLPLAVGFGISFLSRKLRKLA